MGSGPGITSHCPRHDEQVNVLAGLSASRHPVEEELFIACEQLVG
jgi:hypothetical protein